jgi:hypothetical protein
MVQATKLKYAAVATTIHSPSTTRSTIGVPAVTTLEQSATKNRRPWR